MEAYDFSVRKSGTIELFHVACLSPHRTHRAAETCTSRIHTPANSHYFSHQEDVHTAPHEAVSAACERDAFLTPNGWLGSQSWGLMPFEKGTYRCEGRFVNPMDMSAHTAPDFLLDLSLSHCNKGSLIKQCKACLHYTIEEHMG